MLNANILCNFSNKIYIRSSKAESNMVIGISDRLSVLAPTPPTPVTFVSNKKYK